VARVDRGELVRGRDRRHAVARHDREQDLALGAGREQLGDAREHGVVTAEHAAQQRSPREVDRQRAREAAQRRRRALRGRDGEQRVRQRVATRRPARGVDHRVRARVDADHERVGPRGGERQHAAAVARAEVERDPGVTACEAPDLADVDFVELAASDHSEHRRIVSG
jgi:hypothetical protein